MSRRSRAAATPRNPVRPKESFWYMTPIRVIPRSVVSRATISSVSWL